MSPGYYIDCLRKAVEFFLVKKSAYFDENWYLEQYPDARESRLSPRAHYFLKGWRKGYNPNRLFNCRDYIKLNPEIKALNRCHLAHWLMVGKRKGYAYNEKLDRELYQQCANNTPTLKQTRKYYSRGCVIIHLYPPTMLEMVCSHIIDIAGKVDIYILTDTDEKIALYRNFFKSRNLDNLNYKKVVNKGRDTTALLIGARDITDRYEYFCYIHAKETLQSFYGNHWREFLWNNLLGRGRQALAVMEEFERNDKLGMMFPPVYPALIPNDMWDMAGNRKGVEKTLRKKLGIKRKVCGTDAFPVGGMFWGRTAALKKMLDAPWSYREFMPDNKPDGTLRHFVERMWGIVARESGYEIRQYLMPAPPLSTSSHAKNAVLVYAYSEDCESNLDELKGLKNIFNEIHCLRVAKNRRCGDIVFLERNEDIHFYEVGCKNLLHGQLLFLNNFKNGDIGKIVLANTRVKIIGNLLSSFLRESDYDASFFNKTLSGVKNFYLHDFNFTVLDSKILRSGLIKSVLAKLDGQDVVHEDELAFAIETELEENGFVIALCNPLHRMTGSYFNAQNYPYAYIISGAPFYYKSACYKYGEKIKDFVSKIYDQE